MIRSSRNNHMNVVAFHQLAKVFVLDRRFLALGREFLRIGFGMLVIDIAHRHYIAEAPGCSTIAGALPAAAHQGSAFANLGMTRHLENCLQKREASHAGTAHASRTFHLAVQGRGSPQYWLHLLARADTTLGELDSFLRHIWLECCGHMSGFTIKR